MANADEPQQNFFSAGFVEVEALNRAGRWQEALAAGAYLFEQFRGEPRACLGLADTLVAIDRADQAEAVLRDARARFPGEPTLSVRLADLATRRQDWAGALAHWRDAGLPHSGNAAHLRAFALALAQSGDPGAALRLVTSPTKGRPDSRVLLLAQAELHLAAGRIAEAVALWSSLVVAFTLDDPDFAALTGELARLAPPEAAAQMFAALIAEPDPGRADWLPAIARALAPLDPADPLHERVRQALAADPQAAAGMAGAIAAGLAGLQSDSDAQAARVARGIVDGRVSLLPLLLETAGPRQRAERLRVALRLYLNHAFASQEGFDALGTREACALMLVARVVDPECLSYIADLARTRFADPGPRQSYSLPTAEDVLAQVAHAVDRPPGAPLYVQPRLRVALCVSGRLPSVPGATSLVRSLRLQAHDATVFAHVWRSTGTAGPAPGLEAIIRRLPTQLGLAFAAAADAGGMAGLRRLYPALLQGRPANESVTQADVAALFHTDHAVVEDDAADALAGRSAIWKTRHAARRAHLMAAAIGAPFDLYVHIRADALLAADESTDWPEIARAAQQRRVMFADAGYQFHRAHGLGVGTLFALGSKETMDLAADSFVLGDQVATAQASVYGFPPADAMARSLAMQLYLNGVAVEGLPAFAAGGAPELDPVAPAAALALLWQDIRARQSAAPDSTLVRAAMADVTGGLGI